MKIGTDGQEVGSIKWAIVSHLVSTVIGDVVWLYIEEILADFYDFCFIKLFFKKNFSTYFIFLMNFVIS